LDLFHKPAREGYRSSVKPIRDRYRSPSHLVSPQAGKTADLELARAVQPRRAGFSLRDHDSRMREEISA
jgi:hypothetical protein